MIEWGGTDFTFEDRGTLKINLFLENNQFLKNGEPLGNEVIKALYKSPIDRKLINLFKKYYKKYGVEFNSGNLNIESSENSNPNPNSSFVP